MSTQRGGGIGLLRTEQAKITTVAGHIGIRLFALIGVHRCHVRLDSLIADPVGKMAALTRIRGKPYERRFDKISVTGVIAQRALAHQNHRSTNRQFHTWQMIAGNFVAAYQPVQHFLIPLPIAATGINQPAIGIIASPQRPTVGRTSTPHARPMPMRKIAALRRRSRNPLVGPQLLL